MGFARRLWAKGPPVDAHPCNGCQILSTGWSLALATGHSGELPNATTALTTHRTRYAPVGLLLWLALVHPFGLQQAAQAACAGGDPDLCLAVSEATSAGTAQGSFTDTHASDDLYEVLTEQDVTRGRRGKRSDLLEHVWTFNLSSGSIFHFHVEAHRVDTGGDGDNFSFAYSTNGGQSWTPILTVDNGAPDQVYEAPLSADVAGSVLLRAMDTNRRKKPRGHALLLVDHMYVEVSSQDPDPDPTPSSSRIVGYYTSWSIYPRNYFVQDIPAEKVTHINYAFANLDPDGTVVLGDPFADINKAFGNEPPGAPFKGNFQQLQILKSQYPHLKTLLSVGGWTWSDHFSDVFADPQKRTNFCQSLLSLVETYGFDGADIDWEYPGHPGEGDNSFRPGEDAANYVVGLAECRALFPSNKLLTVATPCNPALYEDEMDLAGMIGRLDWVNLLSYDLHGAWDPVTGHHSQLFLNPGDPKASDPLVSRFTQSACISGHFNEGVPPQKITLGIPTYGRSFARVNQSFGGIPPIFGLFQTFNGVPKGTWDSGGGSTGVFDFEDIVTNVLTSSSASREFDPAAQAPTLTWSLGGNKGLGFMTYDDRESVCSKADHALSTGIGGLMFWEFSGDVEDHPESLIQAMFCGLNEGAAGCDGVCP